ncbi:unnamed protein product [Symbiodinium sp. CCMP2592]|nr:unnamed protein product [Symbiodinium sp. CCMP2592]
MEAFYLPLSCFDYSTEGKNDFPHQSQLRAHFLSFISQGNIHRHGFNVRFVDGQCKVLIMQLAVCIAHKLGLEKDVLRTLPSFAMVLCSHTKHASLAAYHYVNKRQPTPLAARSAQNFESSRQKKIERVTAEGKDTNQGAANLTGLGARTAETQAPSALQYMAEIEQAMKCEKALTTRKVTTRELLSKCIADYNKLITVKNGESTPASGSSSPI